MKEEYNKMEIHVDEIDVADVIRTSEPFCVDSIGGDPCYICQI